MAVFFELIERIFGDIGSTMTIIAEEYPAVLIISIILIVLTILGVWCATNSNN